MPILYRAIHIENHPNIQIHMNKDSIQWLFYILVQLQTQLENLTL